MNHFTALRAIFPLNWVNAPRPRLLFFNMSPKVPGSVSHRFGSAGWNNRNFLGTNLIFTVTCWENKQGRKKRSKTHTSTVVCLAPQKESSRVRTATLSCATEQMRVAHRNTESCGNHYPMHICSTCIFITSPVKRRSPLHSVWIFYPPLLTTAFSIFLFKGSSQNKSKTKVLQGGKKSGCSFPLLSQNKRAYCNSPKKICVFSGGLVV